MIKNLRTIFFLDGLGALISTLMLGIVLVRLEAYFGIPKSSLYLLASIPLCFILFDAFAYFTQNSLQRKCLKFIGIANLIYCLFSVAIAISHIDVMTHFGWLYILGEVLVVASIGIFEIKKSSSL